MKKKNILITGKTSRFCKFLKSNLDPKSSIFTSSKEFNILDFSKMNKYLAQKKIKYIINVAGLFKHMKIHEKNISKSINLNIIGTANILEAAKECKSVKIVIVATTDKVYKSKKKIVAFKETDELGEIDLYSASTETSEIKINS